MQRVVSRPDRPPPPSGPAFELTGGNLALDFTNTVEQRAAAEPRDLLRSYGDLLLWSRVAGLLTRRDARALERRAARDRPAAASVLARAINLREALFATFAAAARRKPIPEAALPTLERLFRTSTRRRHLEADHGRVRWNWTADPHDLDRMLWPLVHAALDLATSDQLSPVRVCQAATCRWLFMDRSPQANRRWCDMTICGIRSKAQRHYRRIKVAASASS